MELSYLKLVFNVYLKRVQIFLQIEIAFFSLSFCFERRKL